MDSLNTSFDRENKIWSGPKVFPIHNIEHHSIGRILFGQMRINPRNVIQIDDIDGTSATSGELLTWGTRIALHLKSLKLTHEDIVGIAARNTIHLSSVVLGCLFNCNPFHAVNPNFHEGAIAHCFSLTRPRVIFCDGSDYEKIHVVTKSFEPIIYTLIDHIEGVPSVLDLLLPNPLEGSYQPEKLTLGADQTIAILCSSGTTGLPKAVTISAHKIIIEHPFVNIDTVIYTSSGIDWISGLGTFIHNCYTGFTRILNRKPFRANEFVEMVKKYQIQSAIFAPVQLVELLDCPIFTKENMTSFKILQTGGGYISQQVFENLKLIMPQCFIGISYAITEVGMISIDIGLKRSGSVGKMAPNVQLRIVDEQGRNLNSNEIGEILVHCPYPWAGYYGNPEETQRVMDSLGWYHTGDLGYMDGENFLYIVDRKKDIMKYNGFQYWPGEIENAIRELTDVIDCCVVGIFNER
ncbi:probable 4-coumarate--CoA ligase 1 [Musca domestica]|nr:probable 4-coumarate--CoA ligase 1 [Musca domestica]